MNSFSDYPNIEEKNMKNKAPADPVIEVGSRMLYYSIMSSSGE